MSLTGLKDTDREVLKWIADRELLKVCSIDRKTWNEVCDDNFLKRRLSRYPNIQKYKKQNESWKEFFLKTIYYISKLKKEFQFEYTDGDFQEYYEILKNYTFYHLLGKAAQIGAFSLVKYAIQNGATPHILDLEYAAKGGHLHIIKYLTGNDSNISSLIYASSYGYYNIAKYLVEQGVDIHVLNTSLLEASKTGYVNIVKYLVEHGADIHVDNNKALQKASANGHLNVVKYLVQQGANIYFKTQALQLATGYAPVVKYLKNWNEK
jgi:hypothetical protein